ncbi:hypothetical protein EDB80DRAFT_870181 [Ilyonectria destructans]|nr:hypothetical protein EDB80DRAFT_870181 [Ilyonectria destructans]
MSATKAAELRPPRDVRYSELKSSALGRDQFITPWLDHHFDLRRDDADDVLHLEPWIQTDLRLRARIAFTPDDLTGTPDFPCPRPHEFPERRYPGWIDEKPTAKGLHT